MELEQQIPRQNPPGGGDCSIPEQIGLERIRAEGDGLLNAADKILDSMQPVEAEEYLALSRQRGGQ